MRAIYRITLAHPRAMACCATAMFVLLFSVLPSQAQQRQQLSGHVPAAVTNGSAVSLGALPMNQRMKLAISLPLRNQEQLDHLLKNLYDPKSPQYRQFLSVEEWTARFGPSEADYQLVLDFAREHNLEVFDTPPNRMLVDVSATVADIEQALHVKMLVFKHPTEDRTFYAPDREPSLDTDVSVIHISGLDNYVLPHPKDLRKANTAEKIHSNAGSAPDGSSFLGSDMRAVYYGGTALTGSGQAVGLFEFGPYYTGDVQLYFSTVGQTNNVPIKNVLLDGDTMCTSASNCNDGEQIADIIEPLGMAPGLNELLVYIGSSDVDILNRMASDNLAKQLSCSWGWGADPSSDDPIFEEFAAQGQTFFVASGDGSADNNVGEGSSDFWPADDENTVAVGGTTVYTNGPGGSWLWEIAWFGSAGGPSPYGFLLPNWQAGVPNASNQASTVYRNVPDVAANATNFYSCSSGSCGGGAEGTSYAAPIWAGYLALVNEQAAENGKPPVGFLNPAIYSVGRGASGNYSSDFHDITSDGNFYYSTGFVAYNAVPGFDEVTGWGSPNGESLITALAGEAVCTPTVITPYIQIGGGSWQLTSSISVSSGATVNLGPQPSSGGSWSWTGPNGYKSTSSEISSIPLSTGTNTFVGTYTNSSGCAATQTFYISESGAPANGSYTMTNDTSGLVWDDPNSQSMIGGNIDLWSSNETQAQQWSFTALGSGYYSIFNWAAGLMLDDPGASKSAGTLLDLSTATGTASQEWLLTASGSGYVITNKASGLVVDPNANNDDTYLRQEKSTGKSAQVWLLTPFPTGGPTITPVNLASYFNWTGIYTDGTKFSSGGGLDSQGNAYSGTLLGTSQTWNGIPFTIGAANANNDVYGTGQIISLPAGSFSTLRMLAAATNGGETSQTFTITYTNGTTTTITQSISDWAEPQNYSGESEAVTMSYRDEYNGKKQTITVYLYGYSFPINNTLTVQSITLTNNGNVNVMAITLVP